MGIVYCASDRRLKREVAIKVLPPELSFRADIRQRFLREAETAAQLNHPNIVPIYTVEERDNLVYFVMAFIEGDNLGQRLQQHGPMPTGRSATHSAEVADALAYAHKRNVVHRDIKPDNIIIDDETGRAMVTDFGIARALTDSGDSRLTATGMAIGTPAYMSPEQSAGDATIDGRSDLYSLGVVGYQMLVRPDRRSSPQHSVDAGEAPLGAADSRGRAVARSSARSGSRGHDVSGKGSGRSVPERCRILSGAERRRDADARHARRARRGCPGADGLAAAGRSDDIGTRSRDRFATVMAPAPVAPGTRRPSRPAEELSKWNAPMVVSLPPQARALSRRQRDPGSDLAVLESRLHRSYRDLDGLPRLQVFEALGSGIRLARRVPSAARSADLRCRRRDDRRCARAVR